MLQGLRSVEVDADAFRKYLSEKHGLWVPHFGRMRDVPLEKLDAIADRLIHNAQRLALAQGAGFGLGGMITVLPDASMLTVITLRLIQRLCLLYGFEEHGQDQRVEMWIAAGTAAGIDFSKDLAEKQMIEKLAPPVASRWVGRIIPLASSAIGGALNYAFVRTWGRRVQRHLRERQLAERALAAKVTVLVPSVAP
jgi:hypothetical protein